VFYIYYTADGDEVVITRAGWRGAAEVARNAFFRTPQEVFIFLLLIIIFIFRSPHKVFIILSLLFMIMIIIMIFYFFALPRKFSLLFYCYFIYGFNCFSPQSPASFHPTKPLTLNPKPFALPRKFSSCLPKANQREVSVRGGMSEMN
jgi:hypothetical protein